MMAEQQRAGKVCFFPPKKPEDAAKHLEFIQKQIEEKDEYKKAEKEVK